MGFKLTSDENNKLDVIIHAVENDNVNLKLEIKKKLLNNRLLCWALANKELEAEDAQPEDYYGVSILPYLIIAPIQSKVSNYVCFETIEKLASFDPSKKIQQVIIEILCDETTIDVNKDENGVLSPFGIARHDLIAQLLMREFNSYPFKGGKFQCISNVASITDHNYVTRTLTFQGEMDANLVKTGFTRNSNGEITATSPMFINKIWSDGDSEQSKI